MGLFGNTLSADNHESPVGMLGGGTQKWTDPIAWLPGGLGDKWVNLTSHTIPEKTNQILAPVAQFNGKIDKTINPLRRIPAVDNVMNTVEAKPADAIGTAIGAYFAAPALAGAMGGTAGGAAGGSAAGASGGTGAITAAPGVSAGGGGTALGSTAGMSGSWGPVAGSQGMNPMLQAMLRQQMSGNGLFGGQKQQSQPVQLSAAQGTMPQAQITSGPVVNPVLRQQILTQLRGY